MPSATPDDCPSRGANSLRTLLARSARPLRRLNLSLLGLLGLAAVACDSDAASGEGSPLTLETALTPDGRLAPGVEWGDVPFVRIHGSRVLVVDRRADPRVHALEISTGRLLQSFARVGSGPGEVLDPLWITVVSGDEILIYDYAQRKFSSWRLDSSGQYKLDREWLVSGEQVPFQPVMTSVGMLTNGYFADSLFLILDSDGSPSRWLGASSPLIRREQPVDHATRVRLNRNRMAVHPSGDRVAVAFQSMNRLQILTLKDESSLVLSGPRGIVTAYVDPLTDAAAEQFRWTEENEWAYVAVDASRDEIFALFCGEHCSSSDDFPSILHRWTWGGVFGGEWILDRPVRTIAVDAANSWLVGVSEEPEPILYRWRLPERMQ